jgi:hypothetical protein
VSKTDNVLEAVAKWHIAVLALLALFFAICVVLGVALLVTGRGNPFMILVIGAAGAFAMSRAIARKYAAELSAGRREQDKLNS